MPFATDKPRDRSSLPPDLTARAGDCPYLLDYLCRVPFDGFGPPVFYNELNRKMGQQIKVRNLIYPVRVAEGEAPIFIHIYPDMNDVRDYYVPVEPTLGMDLTAVLAGIEGKLLDAWGELGAAASEPERARTLLRLIDQVCHATREGGWIKNGNGVMRISPVQLAGAKYTVLRDKVGLGVLEPLMRDPYIEDISCSGLGEIFIEHRIFRGLKTVINFSEFDDLDEFVLRLSDRIKAPATARRPIIDSVLPDGSRINIVYGRNISKQGSNFTIRKFSEVPLSVLELIEVGTLDYSMAAYLSLLVAEGANVFVSGETASGKTTLLNAITTFVHPEAKVVSIEDTPELRVPQKNWIREVTKVSAVGEGGAEVTMFELLKAALRQRPNLILVGEIRGEEGAIAFGAMQTGHAVMATFHAGSVDSLIQRLTGSPINIPKTYIDNLNLVVILSQVKLPSGMMGRRVLSVNELVGYDAAANSFSVIEVFRWDPLEDKFVFAAHTTSYLLEEKIALRLGIPPEHKQRIYDEVGRRGKLLQRLHKEQGVRNFYELLQALAKLRKQGEF